MARTVQSGSRDKGERTDGQKKALLRVLGHALDGLSAKIKHKAGETSEPLGPYDGKGKLFEAYITFAVRRELETRGIKANIQACDGTPRDWFLLRGSPGKIKRAAKNIDSEPFHMKLVGKGRKAFELHNSIGWPDHHVKSGLVHEIDLSIAASERCQQLAELKKGTKDLPKPSIAIEAKFRNRGPDKSLGRELTGLAYGLHAGHIILVSSKRAHDTVKKQMEAIPSLRNGAKTQTRDFAFFNTDRLVGDESIFEDIAALIIEETGLLRTLTSSLGFGRRKAKKQ